MITDPISDMLVRIRNAQAVGHGEVSMPFSKMKFAIAGIMKDAGYIAAIDRQKRKSKKSEHEHLVLTLKYDGAAPAFTGMKMISVPSRRMYIKASEIRPVRSGYGLAIISTSKGIMNSREALKSRLGGEIICEIW